MPVAVDLAGAGAARILRGMSAAAAGLMGKGGREEAEADLVQVADKAGADRVEAEVGEADAGEVAVGRVAADLAEVVGMAAVEAGDLDLEVGLEEVGRRGMAERRADCRDLR